MHVQPVRDRIQIGHVDSLATSPRVVVQLGTAPDGLPWLLRVDRSQELSTLFTVVPQVFGLSKREDLPERVRTALENEVAAGLMGIHETRVSDRTVRAFVARRKLKNLLGPTLLAQLLDPRVIKAKESSNASATNVGAMAAREQDDDLLDAVERSLHSLRAKRHLLLDLANGDAYSCSVREDDRALRVPSDPVRPLAWESLHVLGDVEVKLRSMAGEWMVPLDEPAALADGLLKLAQGQRGGWIAYSIPRQNLLEQLVAVARGVNELHRRERVHGDLAPGNVLICKDGTRAFDGLDLAVGEPATAATFEWAAPEQIVGHPVDPRTDVYALGRMATSIVGGVLFGEQTAYIVPIGRAESRRVELLKAEGVFLDVTESSYSRAWQRAWQDLLGRSTHFDRARRPENAATFANELAEVIRQHPITGRVTLEPAFGDVVPVETSRGIEFAHVAVD